MADLNSNPEALQVPTYECERPAGQSHLVSWSKSRSIVAWVVSDYCLKRHTQLVALLHQSVGHGIVSFSNVVYIFIFIHQR